MNLPIAAEWPAIRANLMRKIPELREKYVLAGFDGFVDMIQRIVRQKSGDGSLSYFSSGQEWSLYIADKAGSSFSLETQLLEARAGGNMPLIAGTLARLGLNTHAVGALGWPHPHPAFDRLRACAATYSFANPGTSQAYEFADGKMMLADMGELHNAGWQCLVDRLGISLLQKLYQQADLICLVNWSELDASHNIWEGLVRDCMETSAELRQKYCFTDLSDFSKRTREEMNGLLQLFERIKSRTNWVLGLNRNEALLLCAHLGKNNISNLEDMARFLHGQLDPYCLVVHDAHMAAAIRQDGVSALHSFHTDTPKTLTGAGDHFSAGFCAGILLELPLRDCLLLGNAVAAHLVWKGRTAEDSKELMDFLDSIFMA